MEVKTPRQNVSGQGGPSSSADPPHPFRDGLSGFKGKNPVPAGWGSAGPDGQLLECIQHRLEDRLNQKVRAFTYLRSIFRQSSSVYQVRIDLEADALLAWIKILHGPGGADSRKARQTRRDADLTAHLSGSRTNHAFGVPEMLLAIPEAGVMVTRHAPGERVQNLFETIPRVVWRPGTFGHLAEVSYRCGAWLREFQDLTKDFCPAGGTVAEPLNKKDLPFMADQAIGRLIEAQAAGTLKFSRQELDQIIKRVERLSSQSNGENSFCAVHGDFFAGNLLASAQKITGIDFSSSTCGSPAFDLGYFVFQVETLFNRKIAPKRLPNAIIDAFLHGYGISARVAGFWMDSRAHRIVRYSLASSRVLSLSATEGISPPRRILRMTYARKLVKELGRF